MFVVRRDRPEGLSFFFNKIEIWTGPCPYNFSKKGI